MPLCRPGFQAMTLSMDSEEESEEDEEDEEDEGPTIVNVVPPVQSTSSSGSDGVKKSRGLSSGMAALNVGGTEQYSDSSPPGGKRGRAPPPGMLERQDSFDVTPTMTFEMTQLARHAARLRER